MVHVLCVNVRKTCAEALERALVGLPHRQSFLQLRDEPRSRPPGSQPRFPTTTTSLARYLEVEVPSWIPDDPLVLLARGSGLQRAAAWLMPEEARELVSALVLLDDARFPETAGEAAIPLDGLIEFACDAAADPGEKLLVAASFEGPPSAGAPRSVVRLLREAAITGTAVTDGTDPLRCLRSFPATAHPLLDSPPPDDADSLPAQFLRLLEAELVPFLRALGPAPLPTHEAVR